MQYHTYRKKERKKERKKKKKERNKERNKQRKKLYDIPKERKNRSKRL